MEENCDPDPKPFTRTDAELNAGSSDLVPTVIKHTIKLTEKGLMVKTAHLQNERA